MVRYDEYPPYDPGVNADMVEFGWRIKRLREEHGYSISYVADALYVNTTDIVKWENGDEYPTQYRLGALARLYHVTNRQLIGEVMIKPMDAWL